MITNPSQQPTTLRVELGARGYDIVIGRDVLSQAGALIAPLLKQPRVIIVTDETVGALYLDAVHTSLSSAGIAVDNITVPPGEATKSFEPFAACCDRLLALGVERNDTIVALGGGVIGDFAGFAAAVLLRGIDFVQIPTTLLSQVDSSVGGKTGINTQAGKNLIGAFHQPRLVLADTATLDSLSERHLRAGYAEIVKYGLIGDADFFGWLENNAEALFAGDPEVRARAIEVSCATKARLVAADEREGGVRALLNLGHTFGHALEAEAGYGETLYHGEAVAAGIGLAFELSARLGLCPRADAARVRRHLSAVGLPAGLDGIDLGRPVAADALLAHMGKDKKVSGGRIAFVLARAIGDAFLTTDVALDAARAVLEERHAA